MIRKKVKHIYFKSFIDNADIINTHNYFTSYSEFFIKIFSGEPSQIKALCLMPGDDMAKFLGDLCDAIDEVDTGDGVLVFCDLLFGTPCNCSGALLGKKEYKERVQVITGMNLAMLLEYIGMRDNGMKPSEIIDTGKCGIVDFNELHKQRSQEL